MFQKQKQRILTEYSLSPRCLQSGRTRPYQQFYSWKNYLNTDVDNLYRKIKRQQHKKSVQEQTYQKSKINEENINIETDNYERNSKNIYSQYTYDSIRQNRNCYSKVEIGTNTPVRQKSYHKHRHSNSVFARQKQLQKDDKTKILTIQTNKLRFQTPIQTQAQKYYGKQQNTTRQQASNQKESDHSNQSNQSNQQNLEYENFTINNDNKHNQIFMKKHKKSNPSTQSKQIQCNINQLDLYHLHLKQQQRLYLLKKFMHHYQGIHNLKL